MADERKEKQPTNNRWWFWIVILLIAGVTAASGGTKDSDSEQTTAPEYIANSYTEAEKETTIETEKPKVASHDTGIYKIGIDLPAGDYYITSQNGYSSFAISSNNSGNPDSIIANDNFSTHTLVTVAEGQYLEVTDAVVIPLEDAPALVNGTEISDGVYRVGTDFPAGEYKITPTGDSGYYKISTDMTHDSDSIIANNTVTEDKYLTVYDDQILKLNGITLILE